MAGWTEGLKDAAAGLAVGALSQHKLAGAVLALGGALVKASQTLRVRAWATNQGDDGFHLGLQVSPREAPADQAPWLDLALDFGGRRRPDSFTRTVTAHDRASGQTQILSQDNDRRRGLDDLAGVVSAFADTAVARGALSPAEGQRVAASIRQAAPRFQAAVEDGYRATDDGRVPAPDGRVPARDGPVPAGAPRPRRP